MQIKKCKREDFELLNKRLPAVKDKHLWRYHLQEMNRGVYLIAWDKNMPVGVLVLIYDGVGVKDATNMITGCTDIQYLYVKENQRRLGTGEALIKEAINYTKRHNYKKIGLLVDKENTPAKNLYHKLGFKKSKLGDYPGKSVEIIDGQEVKTKVIAEYWIQDLAGLIWP